MGTKYIFQESVVLISPEQKQAQCSGEISTTIYTDKHCIFSFYKKKWNVWHTFILQFANTKLAFK